MDYQVPVEMSIALLNRLHSFQLTGGKADYCSVDATAHYSYAWAQNVHVPHSDQQVNEAVREQINYVLDEDEIIGKGPNGTLSMVFDGIKKLNKVICGYYESIELNFMVPGHTKFKCDGNCVDHVVEVVKKSSVARLNKARRYNNRAGFQYFGLEAYFKKLPGLQKFQHFLFTRANPSVVKVQEFASDPFQEFRLLKIGKSEASKSIEKINRRSLKEDLISELVVVSSTLSKGKGGEESFVVKSKRRRFSNALANFPQAKLGIIFVERIGNENHPDFDLYVDDHASIIDSTRKHLGESKYYAMPNYKCSRHLQADNIYHITTSVSDLKDEDFVRAAEEYKQKINLKDGKQRAVDGKSKLNASNDVTSSLCLILLRSGSYDRLSGKPGDRTIWNYRI
ncbi:hypothetical protein G9A89_005473 [Geosiphon pyriformis]|nr:hypothetical protein G9A89_005473 [Geosiphon pyriformis]